MWTTAQGMGKNWFSLSIDYARQTEEILVKEEDIIIKFRRKVSYFFNLCLVKSPLTQF